MVRDDVRGSPGLSLWITRAGADFGSFPDNPVFNSPLYLYLVVRNPSVYDPLLHVYVKSILYLVNGSGLHLARHDKSQFYDGGAWTYSRRRVMSNLKCEAWFHQSLATCWVILGMLSSRLNVVVYSNTLGINVL